MLTFLFSDISDTCHVLLGILFLIITRWTIQAIKEFWVPGSKKNLKKYLAPCLPSLQGPRGKGTDPERSPEDLNLEYTLSTLDNNIQYLAWQMQRITGLPPCSSPSNTSVETVIPHFSWTRSSGRRRPRMPPSSTPALWGRDVPSGQLEQHLARTSGAASRQVRVESLSQAEAGFRVRRRQPQEQRGGPTPHSECLPRLTPPTPALHPGVERANPSMQARPARILSYKEQELLNWHIQKKHQPKAVAPVHLVASRAPIGRDETPAGGTALWATQPSRRPTPPQNTTQGRRTPPRSPRAQSPTCGAGPPGPPPPEEQPPPPVLICKSKSPSKISRSAQVKVSGGIPQEELAEMLDGLGQRKSPTLREPERPRTPQEELAEMLNMLGQRKSPTLREPERPRTPKEKEKDSHSPARRPGSPKGDPGRVGSVGDPNDKPAEAKVSLRREQMMHTLSWTNMPEFQRPSPTREQAATAQPKFLDPSFMCQNQLELPCIAAAREQQKSDTCAEPGPRLPARTPAPQCLAHSIVQSLDTERAMRDLQMHLAKGLEAGHSQPSVEYPICLLCGRCTPSCPHPQTRHSPRLLVYPRLGVRDGEVYMTLGFLLKIKRSEADEWGLTQGRDMLPLPRSKERPSKKEKSRRTAPRRKSYPLEAGPRPQEPETLDKTPRLVRELSPEHGDWNTRSPVMTPQGPWAIANTPAPKTPQAPETQLYPPSTRPQSRRTTPQRKNHPLAAEPKTLDKTLPVVRELFPEHDDQNTRSPVTTPRGPGVATIPAPVTPQTPETRLRPLSAGLPSPPARPPQPPARPPRPPARLPRPPARPPQPPAGKVPPKPPEKPLSILKLLLSTIKRLWATVLREVEKCPEMCSEKFCPKKSSPSKKSGTPLPAPVSSEPHKESRALSLQSSASGAQAKGDISNTAPASPLFTSKQEASPIKLATPQTSPKAGTSILKQDTSSKQTTPQGCKGRSLHFKEPDSPPVSKKGASRLKKSASPRMSRKSPSMLRRTPSRQGTP